MVRHWLRDMGQIPFLAGGDLGRLVVAGWAQALLPVPVLPGSERQEETMERRMGMTEHTEHPELVLKGAHIDALYDHLAEEEGSTEMSRVDFHKDYNEWGMVIAIYNMGFEQGTVEN